MSTAVWMPREEVVEETRGGGPGERPEDLTSLLTHFREAVGADSAALLTAVAGGEVRGRQLSVEALALRSRVLERGPDVESEGGLGAAVLSWTRGSLLGRAMEGDHAIVKALPAGGNGHRADATLTVIAPIRPAGTCLGALYASIVPPPEATDTPRLARVADLYAAEAALSLVRRPWH